MITVSAAEDSIDASGTSRVHLHAAGTLGDEDIGSDNDPIDLIAITGSTGIHAQGNATVEIEAPWRCAIVGMEEHLSQNGNASILTTCSNRSRDEITWRFVSSRETPSQRLYVVTSQGARCHRSNG
jgi:hypothetical protein